MTRNPIKVFIVDDTVTYRKILSDVVNNIPGTEFAGSAPSGSIALKKLVRTPADLILLDVIMPDMSGVETLKHIRKQFPDTAVIMVSGTAGRDADTTIEALNLGAIDFLEKPKSTGGYEAGIATLRKGLEPIIRTIGVRRTPTPRPPPPSTPPPKPVSPTPPSQRQTVLGTKCNLVLIGVSTGGPNALKEVIPKLPENLKAPVLIVQHMPPVFTASLAEHLNRISRLTIKEASEKDIIKAGDVWIAPGGRHMTLKEERSDGTLFTSLNDSPPVNSCRPSVDVLFRSCKLISKAKILTVILTGMGDDGAAGVASLKRAGCHCIVQNEETCVVYGMPRAIVERNLADEILPLDRIPQRIVDLTGN